ncbi:hypothetical protein F2Q69_00030359 [Brassica cretica]|uniref:Uncharacterized protein n=1 Tax=Brassica cretica TaxID=69181 RepID=A0A8S9RYT0_BRACR|nr:hypothetical protein F2Q69_00030359 [Brassica cretica]
MNPELLMFPSSLVGGRPRPRHPFTDPFSSSVPSWGDVPEADSEAVSMAPLRRLRSCFFDDGPRSEIRERDLANMRRKYAINPSVGIRSPTKFERAPDGGAAGAGEVAIYEAYLEAGFRGVIPSLIGEVSTFFGFCPSQLTPLTWRTLMAIQVLGKLHGFSVGTTDIGSVPTFPGKINARNKRDKVLLDKKGRLTPNTSMTQGFPSHQKAKAWKRCLSYTPPPRLARAALSAKVLSSTSSTSAEVIPNRDPLVDAHRRLIGEVFLLRSQVQDMMARRDLLVQQVKASAKWELMKEWLEKRVGIGIRTKSIGVICSYLEGSTIRQGASPRLQPRDPL